MECYISGMVYESKWMLLVPMVETSLSSMRSCPDFHFIRILGTISSYIL